jgi:DNA-binding IclR family transcriptional regulator
MATTMSYEDLKKKTVAELRDMAKSLTHEAVQGYTQMNKEHLLPALCKALGIEHAHHHVEAGFDKSKLKMRMKMLRVERDKALETHNSAKLKVIRTELHTLNHRIRSHVV